MGDLPSNQHFMEFENTEIALWLLQGHSDYMGTPFQLVPSFLLVIAMV